MKRSKYSFHDFSAIHTPSATLSSNCDLRFSLFWGWWVNWVCIRFVEFCFGFVCWTFVCYVEGGEIMKKKIGQIYSPVILTWTHHSISSILKVIFFIFQPEEEGPDARCWSSLPSDHSGIHSRHIACVYIALGHVKHHFIQFFKSTKHAFYYGLNRQGCYIIIDYFDYCI